MKLLLDTHAAIWWLSDDERPADPGSSAPGDIQLTIERHIGLHLPETAAVSPAARDEGRDPPTGAPR